MFYTGIDLHKFTSYLTTVDSSGNIVKQADIKNVSHNFVQYFSDLGNGNITTVESTMTWYWLNDLLTSMNIPLVLAHAKYVKAIVYAKVKTDKIDSHTLAQLLRMDYIPAVNKISNDKRLLRDALRARLKIVQRYTSITNSIQLLLAKYNFETQRVNPNSVPLKTATNTLRLLSPTLLFMPCSIIRLSVNTTALCFGRKINK